MFKVFDVIALGELICRLSPSIHNERLSRCTEFTRQIGGAEFNVVAALSSLGLSTGIITKIPNNDLGIYVKNSVRSLGVSDDLIIYDTSSSARLALYFSESGAYPRKPSIIYDRDFSSFRTLTIKEIPPYILDPSKAKFLHVSGITLALCKEIREQTIEIIKSFKKTGVIISFDVNFRANLWDETLARETITELLPYVDIFFCSEETANKTFQRTGSIDQILRGFSKDYNIPIVCSTKRTAHSPKLHSFTSFVYNAHTDTVYTEEPYNNIDVVDRIGSGDAYIAGVLYGLITNNYDCFKALQYGNAFSVLKNTIPGDTLCSSLAEINSIIATHNGTGSNSEINR